MVSSLFIEFIIFKTFYRPDSFNNHYICGKSPRQDEEPDVANLDVDHDYFEKEIWSTLAHRVPAFEEAKVNLYL